MKKFIAFCLSLIMACAIFSGCGKADKDKKEKTNEKKSTTTTTTVAETTAAEETASVEDSYVKSGFELLNERTLNDGTKVKVFQNVEESSVSISINYSTNNIVSNLLVFMNFFSACRDAANKTDFLEKIVIYGNYDGRTRCADEIRKIDDEYDSPTGMIFYDEEYKSTYKSILDGTIDISESTTDSSESTSDHAKDDTQSASDDKKDDTESASDNSTTSEPEPKAEEYTSIYEDDNVKIEFYGIETKSYNDCVVFYVTNKNDFEITIQCSSISLDGIQIDGDPIMSDKVAPQSKAKVYARYDSIENKNPSTVSGVLRIIDFSREYFDSYDVTFINVEIN